MVKSMRATASLLLLFAATNASALIPRNLETRVWASDPKIDARIRAERLGTPGSHQGNSVGYDETASSPVHQYDPETALVYARARYYDPDVGRFLSRDTHEGSYGDVPSLHRYVYGRVNPLVYVDEDGNEAAQWAQDWRKFQEKYWYSGEQINSNVKQRANELEQYVAENSGGSVLAGLGVTAVTTSMQVAGGMWSMLMDPTSAARGVMGLGVGAARGVERFERGQQLEGALDVIADASAAVGTAGGVYMLATGGLAGSQPRQPAAPTVRQSMRSVPRNAPERAMVAGENAMPAPIATEMVESASAPASRPIPQPAEGVSAGAPIRYGPMNKGPLPDTVADTFRSSSYTGMALEDSMLLYRVHGGKAAELGAYWTRTPPAGPLQSQIDAALSPAWGNTATNVTTMRVPAETIIYEGAAASQGSLVGGGKSGCCSKCRSVLDN